MKKCPICGNENPDDYNFCSSCGQNISISVEPSAPLPPPLSNKMLVYIADSFTNNPMKSYRRVGLKFGAISLGVIGFIIFMTIVTSPRDSNEIVTPMHSESSFTKTSTETVIPSWTPTLAPIANLSLIYDVRLRKGPGDNFDGADLAIHGETLPVYGLYDETWLLVDYINQLWVKTSAGTLDTDLSTLPSFPTFTPTATLTFTPTQTSIPTRTPIPPISIYSIYLNYQNMTELQRSKFREEVIGRTVDEVVKVGNVDEYGRVFLHGSWSDSLFSYYDFCAFVTGYPQDKALELKAGSIFRLNATVTNFVGNYNYFYNCEYTLVLAYNNN